MEDMCQLSLRLAEHKYQGSHEQIAKIIAQYSENPGVDLVRFWELVLFCYLTGNADMHLKNFSLLKSPRTGWRLAPAYDLVATALVNPADKEETALALNGKKRKLNWRDFETAFSTSGLNPKQVGRIVRRMHQASQLWGPAIDNSFLGAEYKAAFHTLLAERMRLLPVG
jgi:serine/threonine-protein kinase HipA